MEESDAPAVEMPGLGVGLWAGAIADAKAGVQTHAPGVGYFISCTIPCTCCWDNNYRRGIFVAREDADRRVAYIVKHPEVVPIVVPGHMHDASRLGRPTWEYLVTPINYAKLGNGKIAIEEWPGGGTWYGANQLFSSSEEGRPVSAQHGDLVPDGDEYF